jgi:RHS repeat-associated protein
VLSGANASKIGNVDAVGSMVMVTDQAGAASGDIVYDPWGNAMAGGGSNGDAFAGLEYQVNYLLPPSATRDYNDGLGRWMTPDPGGRKVVNLANPQSWNMYDYVGDNPTTLNDPSGLQSPSSEQVASCTRSNSNGCAQVWNQKKAANEAAAAKKTYTVTYKISETSKVDSGGTITFTIVTATATFDKATNKYESATTETTSYQVSADAFGRNVVSNQTESGPQSLTQSQFTNLLNNQEQSVDPGAAVWYARAQAHDIAAHPRRYLEHAAGFAVPGLDIGEAAEGIITGVEAIKTAVEFVNEMHDLGK